MSWPDQVRRCEGPGCDHPLVAPVYRMSRPAQASRRFCSHECAGAARSIANARARLAAFGLVPIAVDASTGTAIEELRVELARSVAMIERLAAGLSWYRELAGRLTDRLHAAEPPC